MIENNSYRIAAVLAVFLHLLVAYLLIAEHTSSKPAVLEVAKPSVNPHDLENTAIRAVSVDNEAVMKTVNHLKEERIKKQQAEDNRQRVLKQLATEAQKKRIEEQQRLVKLKNEAKQIALAKEKALVEEKKRQALAEEQRKVEEQRLAKLKQQQVELQKKQEALVQQKRAEQLKHQEVLRQQVEKENRDKALKQQASEEAARHALEQHAMQGEVDKYKALIIQAISRQWILPEHIDPGLASQFRIRLAPNGAVLEVNLTQSSGDPILDRSAQSAIYKASPLPVPNDPQTFNVFRDISLTVRPENVRG